MSRTCPSRTSLSVRSMLLLAAASSCAVSAAGAARADVYGFIVNSAASSLATDLTASGTLAGTLVGDYDEAANPTGTRTIPGLFGPTTGNTPIPFSGTAGFTGSDTTRPTGGFRLDLDLETNLATVSGLSLDLLNGREIGVTLGLVIQYDTFRTRQPSALYIGGIPLPIPFGQVQLTTLALEQTELTGAGVITETGPDQYSVVLIAQVNLTAEIDVLGTPQAIGPIALPLPITADITITGDTATATFAFDAMFQQDIPIMVDLPQNQALDLPTVLPPGSTAHLLFSAALDGAMIDFSLGANLVSNGTRQVSLRADWNHDGIINSADLFAFLTDFFSLTADFNADGFVNSQDFYDFLVAFFEGR